MDEEDGSAVRRLRWRDAGRQPQRRIARQVRPRGPIRYTVAQSRRPELLRLQGEGSSFTADDIVDGDEAARRLARVLARLDAPRA